jgi:hypothetical protein
MQIKQTISDWANRWFFVKDKKAALTIALLSVGIGLAVDIGLVIYRRTHEEFFLNQHGRLFDMAFRFVALFAVTFFVFCWCLEFTICARDEPLA